jgi:hypothetical protein
MCITRDNGDVLAVDVAETAQTLSERFVEGLGNDGIAAKNLPNSGQLSGVFGASQPGADGQQAAENDPRNRPSQFSPHPFSKGGSSAK